MRKILSVLVLAALLVTASDSAMAQQKEKKVVESQRITKENPNVAKLKEAVNDKKNGMNDVPKQNGPVYGDDYCDVVIDNYTNLYIKVWVDNNYKGIVGPYGKITVAAAPGKTVLYARADFTDGSYSYWNPPAFDCGWEYTWRLR